MKGQIALSENWPYEVFAKQWEGLFLVVAEHLKDDGLRFNVLNKRLGHFHSNLIGKKVQNEQQAKHISTDELKHVTYPTFWTW